LDETRLIAALKSGDPAAQEALDRAYHRRLLATAWHILGPRDPDAEDAVQEAFLAVHRGIGAFEGRSSLYTWLNQICVNRCYDQVRKRKRLLATEAQDLERLLVPASLAQSPNEAAQTQQRHEQLKGWIESMEAKCREILGLRFVAGMPLAEIKARLKVPLGTVASRLRRCQQALHAKARES
jgi:RNA polymerase sigma-70 factor, ECF subfamily